MVNLLDYLRSQAINKVLRGGSRIWLLLGAVAWVIRIVGRASNTKSLRPVLTEELASGESLIISHIPKQNG